VITGSAEAEVAEVEDAVVLRKPLDVDRLLTTLRRISRPDRS
jgi:hypothetical protein